MSYPFIQPLLAIIAAALWAIAVFLGKIWEVLDRLANSKESGKPTEGK